MIDLYSTRPQSSEVGRLTDHNVAALCIRSNAGTAEKSALLQPQ